MAEDLAAEQFAGDRAAVQRDEGLLPAVALLMDEAGEQLLADPRLALDQERDLGVRSARRGGPTSTAERNAAHSPTMPSGYRRRRPASASVEPDRTAEALDGNTSAAPRISAVEPQRGEAADPQQRVRKRASRRLGDVGQGPFEDLVAAVDDLGALASRARSRGHVVDVGRAAEPVDDDEAVPAAVARRIGDEGFKEAGALLALPLRELLLDFAGDRRDEHPVVRPENRRYAPRGRTRRSPNRRADRGSARRRRSSA